MAAIWGRVARCASPRARPSKAERDRARRVVAADEETARRDGQMINRPAAAGPHPRQGRCLGQGDAVAGS